MREEIRLESVDFEYKGNEYTVKYINVLFKTPEQAIERAKDEIDKAELIRILEKGEKDYKEGQYSSSDEVSKRIDEKLDKVKEEGKAENDEI